MNKTLPVAPPLPAGSIDFTRFEAACAAGDPNAAAKAVIDTAPASPSIASKDARKAR